MAYTKKTWQYGDLIDASSLNNMEDGIKNLSDIIPEVASTIPNGTYVLKATKIGSTINYAWGLGNEPWILLDQHSVEFTTSQAVNIPYHFNLGQYDSNNYNHIIQATTFDYNVISVADGEDPSNPILAITPLSTNGTTTATLTLYITDENDNIVYATDDIVVVNNSKN